MHCEFFGRPKSERDRRIVAEILAMSSRKNLTGLTFLTVDKKLEKALSTVLPSVARDHPGRVAAIKHQLLRSGS